MKSTDHAICSGRCKTDIINLQAKITVHFEEVFQSLLWNLGNYIPL